jgi:NADH-quinone oxidoreductase subunit L
VTLEVVAVIGAATALMAATIGLAQTDIKRVLAYSTVSQLGYMFMACGAGAYGVGIFHVMTHAFFKALLFLGAGSVIHALSGEQDMRRMGGLASKLPWTHGTMAVAWLAIAGVPFFSGFFSKDEILASEFASGHYGIWACGILGALLTAFYMTRLYVLTFRGPSRLSHEAEHHLHESPPSMIAPLVILAALAFFGGDVGLPFQEGGNLFHRWLRPVMESGEVGGAHHELSTGTEWTLLLLSVLVVAVGIGTALQAYLFNPGLGTSLRERFAPLHRVFENKYWVDEIYNAIVVRPFMAISQWLWRVWDSLVVDGLVNGVGYTLELGSGMLKLVQTGFVGTYALWIALGVIALLFHVLHFMR